MEGGNENSGFNRKRAESDRPKNNLQLKVRKLNPVNTSCYVQILGTGMDTHDTSPSVLLFFDHQRFIFNAGEGLQRFCSEHKIKLLRIDHIFLSRVCSETAGGLPGLLLTVKNQGVSVNLWGSSDINYLVEAMKSFIPRAALVHKHSFGTQPGLNGFSSGTSNMFDEPIVLIDDEVVKISAILLRPTHCERVDSPEPKKATQPADLSVVYICELPEIKGEFDPRKAASLGLRPGPKYRELQLGNSVKSDHQDIMVHPGDVMASSVPGPIVMLVDCPTLLHLKELLSLQCLAPYTALNIPENSEENLEKKSEFVNCIIHLSPTCVTKTDDYRMWMSKFSGFQHIMTGHEMKNMEVPIFKSSARIGARLNYLCPQFFPSPYSWSSEHLNCLPPDPKASNKILLSRPKLIEPAKNLLKFRLRPYKQRGLDTLDIPNLSSHAEIIDELLSEIPEIADASKQVMRFWLGNGETSMEKASIDSCETMTEESAIPSCLEDISREDTEIVLLGTGSSQPSKYRNVSSIFINLFSKGSLLLDCGEGTLGQLKRRFGVKGADEALRGLKCIWISHIHADHHAGLARILVLRRNLLKGLPHKPILVVGPGQLKLFLDAYKELEDLDMQFLDCWHTTTDEVFKLKVKKSSTGWSPIQSADDADPIRESLKKVLKGAGLEALISFPVIHSREEAELEAEALENFPVTHCLEAFGVVLKAENRINRVGKTIPGWKIVYSGDTRPCPDYVTASDGANGTVLIHEATFEDSMQKEAEKKFHSTTEEAIGVGDSTVAYRTILTHFSQRYPKIPVINETHMHKTCIAFDLMSVNLADVHVLPKVLPYLKLLFRDDMIVDESEDVDLATEVA